jgi:hypothetical protein
MVRHKAQFKNTTAIIKSVYLNLDFSMDKAGCQSNLQKWIGRTLVGKRVFEKIPFFNLNYQMISLSDLVFITIS